MVIKVYVLFSVKHGHDGGDQDDEGIYVIVRLCNSQDDDNEGIYVTVRLCNSQDDDNEGIYICYSKIV